MRPERNSSNRWLWYWCAVIVASSGLFGYLHADAPQVAAERPQPISTPHHLPNQATFEQMELTLAQAGCPGWMVLASEGESALRPGDSAASSIVEQTAYQTAARTGGANSPQHVRVACRLLVSPQSINDAQLTTSPADAPDDLLDGMPDLLAEPAEPERPEPVEQPSSKPEPKQSAPVEEPQLPLLNEPQLKAQPARPPAPRSDSPETRLQQTPKPDLRSPAPIRPKPRVSVPAAEPTRVAPEPQRKPPQPAQPQATAPTLPISKPPPPTPPVRMRPANQTPQLRPEPQRLRVPEQLTLPQPEQASPAAPVRSKPQQSPFAPPPQPKQSPPHSIGPKTGDSVAKQKSDAETKTYCEYVAESQYPSAFVCAKCHQKIFDEWSISSHAYAAISPMFHKFEQTINDLSQGTVGYFCYRCHVPVGTNLGVSRAAPLWDLPQVAREGVTCIACHRVNQRYGKVNGHRRIEPGSIYDPVYGSIGGGGIAEVVAQKDKYKVKTSPHDKGPGQGIHVVGQKFDQLGKSEFCVSCHQVAVHPGIKLEVVWEQYRASPACKKGVSCQDCHMGRLPGVPSGYEYGAAAEVSEKVVNKNRKHANHVFYGPGYSIAHPGVFPHNKDALRWPMQDWLQFNWRAGWGTDDFEEAIEDGKIRVAFPKIWSEADDRYDAREVIDDNLKMLQVKKLSRQQTMENGSHVDGPYFDTPLVRGRKLKFHYIMTNTNEGHNLPSGSLGAQPQLWANVVLIGPRGQRLWESGYTDSYGDVADIHSVDVRNKRIPHDWQLFNLQTMFLITGAKGTDREFFLPVNFDLDQLPYLRPGAQPTSVINHPPFIRMEGRSLAPLGSRKIPYQIPAELMREPGHYRLSFRLRSRAEPIYFMRFCGSTKEMNRAMNEWIVDFHESSVEFFVK